MAIDPYLQAALDGTTVDELTPLARILEVDLSAQSSGFAGDGLKAEIWESLSYYGSNDFAYLARGFEGVDYATIVRDACKAAGMKNVDGGVEAQEHALLRHLFEKIWEEMSPEERAELLRELDASGRGAAAFVLGGAPFALLFGGNLGGFATYRLAVVVANFVARALLGSGLGFATNAALTRALSVALGPVGWVAGGVWLAASLASPARRKTVPAVVQIAALRELNKNRDIIGVVGSGSVGKSSLLEHVFGVDTKTIDPIPGSTKGVTVFELPGHTRIRLLDFPGYEDLKGDVRAEVWDQIGNASLILYVARGDVVVQSSELERYDEVRSRAKALEVVLTYCDKIDDDVRAKTLAEQRKRLKLTKEPVLSCMKKKTPLSPYFTEGIKEIRDRIDAWAKAKGHPWIFQRGAPNPEF